MAKKIINDASHLSDEALLSELAKRKAKKMASFKTLTEIELALEKEKAVLGEDSMIEVLLQRCRDENAKPKTCPKCGQKAYVEKKKAPRRLQTLSGMQTYLRHYFRCKKCQHGFAPVDDELQIPIDGQVSLEVEKRIADFGVNDVFTEAASRFSMHYSFEISDNLVRRVVDRIGVAMESIPEEELQESLRPASTTSTDLLTISVDGSMLSTRAGYKETKLGIVVRGEHHLKGKKKKRGIITQARYVAATDVSEMENRLWAAALASGIESAKRIAFVSDGAIWIRLLAEKLFPRATHILDWMHAVSHLMDCGKALLGENHVLLSSWENTTLSLAWNGQIDELISQLNELLTEDVPVLAVVNLRNYLNDNKSRMQYAAFAAAGLPTGSGIIESAHRYVLQARMKRAGQHWEPIKCHRMAKLRAASRTGGIHFVGRIRSALGKSGT
jgi:Uncharacterised protein family (UPF0236)